MKTASPNPALAHERCQYRTPTGRQCASRILDPESSYCVRHSFSQPLASQPPDSQPSDSQDFAALLTEKASDFQDPQGINHSLAALYKLLASGRISPRRATGLAYIASLLLRTLPGIREQIIETTDFSQFVPCQGPRRMLRRRTTPNTPRARIARRRRPARPRAARPSFSATPSASLPAWAGLRTPSLPSSRLNTNASVIERSASTCRDRPACGQPASRGGFTCRGRAVVSDSGPQRPSVPPHTFNVETAF